MVPTAMCSNTGKLPSWVGAAGTPVLPGERQDDVAVVPEVERLRQAAVHEDVAVAAGVAVPAIASAISALPDLGAGEAVDGDVVVVSSNIMTAARVISVGAAGAPQPAQFGGLSA